MFFPRYIRGPNPRFCARWVEIDRRGFVDPSGVAGGTPDWEFLEVDHLRLTADGATRTLIWFCDARVALERLFGATAAA